MKSNFFVALLLHNDEEIMKISSLWCYFEAVLGEQPNSSL